MLKRLFKKGFRILQRDDNLGINICSGDTLGLYYTDDDGNEQEILREEIKDSMYINSAIIFDFENELGMKRGIGGAFGEKE